MHPFTITISLLALAAAYFILPVIMTSIPAIAVGCVWPDGVANIIEMNAQPEATFGWWIGLIDAALPYGWGYQPGTSDGTYLGCIQYQSRSLTILISSAVVPFMLFVVPGATIFGWLCGKLWAIR